MVNEKAPLESEQDKDLDRLDYVKAHVEMPHVSPITRLVEKKFKQEGKEFDPDGVKEICYAFLEKAIENTQIFYSERQKASFPYTSIDTRDVAKLLFKKYTGSNTEDLKRPSDKKRKEFLFGSFQKIDHGNQLTFTEEALHQIMKELPEALDKLKKGEEPDSNEVTILGSPTTLTGKMSPEFLEELKRDPFGSYGDMYAELVRTKLPQNAKERKNTNLLFYGISMGGSFASETASKLLEDNSVTQQREEEAPYLAVRIDTPPGPEYKSGLRSKLKLAFGFGKDVAKELVIDPYTRAVILGNAKYIKQVNSILEGKGIKSDISPEQLSMKKLGIRYVLEGLTRGVPIPKDLKVVEVKGLEDSLTYSEQFNDEIYHQREAHAGTLGMHRQSRGNITSYGADMGHGIPFMRRENEIKRMAKAVEAIQSLK